MANLINNLWVSGAIIFFGASLLNVVLNTIKNICCVRYGRLSNTIMNVITYGFYTVVVKQISGYDLTMTISVTMIANLIGTYVSYIILDRLNKDKLWKIEVTIPTRFSSAVAFDLTKIPHSVIVVDDKYTLFNFYCSTQKQSQMVKDICSQYEAKFFVSESKSL